MQFSIITPSFRSGVWLRLCIASVADQRGVTHEHVVQDAGSDDGTLDWLPGDSRVCAFVEKDAGMYDAINRGLERARGEFCAYLNCDEQYLPSTLARVAQHFAEHPETEVVFGDALLIDLDGRPLSYRRAVLPRRAHVRLVHLNTLSCAMFFRRALFERGHRFDPRWRAIGDAVWVEQLLAAGVRMSVLPEPLAAFTFTGENLGATGRAEAEAREWRGGGWKRAFVPFLSLAHRLEKWRADAYRPHAVEAALFTKASPDRRERFYTEALGFGWPRSE